MSLALSQEPWRPSVPDIRFVKEITQQGTPASYNPSREHLMEPDHGPFDRQESHRTREYRAAAGDTMGCAGDLRGRGAGLRYPLLA